MCRSIPLILRVFAAAFLTAAGLLSVPSQASAADATWQCNQGVYWHGGTTSTRAYTSSMHCQTKYLRATYYLYPGSPYYTSGWYYSATAVSKDFPIIVNAQHKVQSCQYPYGCGPYTTYP